MTAVLLIGAVVFGLQPARAQQLDSHVVLRRYAAALATLRVPKNVIFSYSISQAGPSDIEQRHTIYRSGLAIRDELLGSGVKGKATFIGHRPDRYAIGRIAPSPGAYGFVFVRAATIEGTGVYIYDAIPYPGTTNNGFIVTQIAIDSVRFLPRTIVFRTTNGVSVGKGTLHYAPAGAYWMPVSATVTVEFNGKPARERIAWSGYQFPASLPALTFIR